MLFGVLYGLFCYFSGILSGSTPQARCRHQDPGDAEDGVLPLQGRGKDSRAAPPAQGGHPCRSAVGRVLRDPPPRRVPPPRAGRGRRLEHLHLLPSRYVLSSLLGIDGCRRHEILFRTLGGRVTGRVLQIRALFSLNKDIPVYFEAVARERVNPHVNLWGRECNYLRE